jgi:hypothetical protein
MFKKETAMAKKAAKVPSDVQEPEAAKQAAGRIVTLTSVYTKRQTWTRFDQWLIGESPLITHAWSEKAKREMLAKMVKAVRHVKEERNPQEEFVSSLYHIGGGQFGFPVTAIKKAIWSQAHKDKGIPKTEVQAGLWLDFKLIQQRPALAGVKCNMPLVRIYGADPTTREDMVRIKGRGGTAANFAYPGEFWLWAMHLTGKFDPERIPPEVLAWLIENGDRATGIGDWRNERSGIVGAFRLADENEAAAWSRFAAGKGPMPLPPEFAEAAE